MTQTCSVTQNAAAISQMPNGYDHCVPYSFPTFDHTLICGEARYWNHKVFACVDCPDGCLICEADIFNEFEAMCLHGKTKTDGTDQIQFTYFRVDTDNVRTNLCLPGYYFDEVSGLCDGFCMYDEVGLETCGECSVEPPAATPDALGIYPFPSTCTDCYDSDETFPTCTAYPPGVGNWRQAGTDVPCPNSCAKCEITGTLCTVCKAPWEINDLNLCSCPEDKGFIMRDGEC